MYICIDICIYSIYVCVYYIYILYIYIYILYRLIAAKVSFIWLTNEISSVFFKLEKIDNFRPF